MKDDKGKWLGYGLGDRGPEVETIRTKLAFKYGWARDMGMGAGSEYDALTVKAVSEFQRRASLPVTGIANLATRIRLGAYPPPPPPRHAILCFRGTGGVLGLDYVDRIADAAAKFVEKVDVAPELMPSMGAAPVGAATKITALSGDESVDYMVDWAVSWKLARPGRTLFVAGYSLGAIAATKFFLEFLPGGRLAQFRDHFAGAVTVGSPARSFGHTFYLGAIPAGEGISGVRIPEPDRLAIGWRWCDLVDAGDLYSNVVGGPDVLEICRNAYDMVMAQQVHDPGEMIRDMIPLIAEMLSDTGVTLPMLNIGGIGVGAFSGLLTALGAPKSLLLPGGTAGSSAAVQAAIQGLRFAATQPPTAPHISYEWTEAIPGRSYLDLGVQHITDWARRTPVLT